MGAKGEMSEPHPFRRIVLPLAVAETVVWAAMYYAFPALLPEWERDTGWSKTELSAAFTLALVVAARSEVGHPGAANVDLEKPARSFAFVAHLVLGHEFPVLRVEVALGQGARLGVR